MRVYNAVDGVLAQTESLKLGQDLRRPPTLLCNSQVVISQLGFTKGRTYLPARIHSSSEGLQGEEKTEQHFLVVC